jgi:hypothetical protein
MEGGEPMASKKPKPPPEPAIDQFSWLEDCDCWNGLADGLRDHSPDDGFAEDLATIFERCADLIEQGQPARAVTALHRGSKLCFRFSKEYRLCRQLWLLGLTAGTEVDTDQLLVTVTAALERCGVKIKEDSHAG